MSFRQIIVLDCGVRCVSAAAFSEKRGALCCESLASQTLSPSAAEDWPMSIAEAIRGLSATIPRGARVVVVLPSHVVTLKHIRAPRTAVAKSRQVLAFAVEQAMPRATGELVWDAIGATTVGEETDHLVVAFRTGALEPIWQAMEAARLELVQVLPSILALRGAQTPISAVPCRLLIETGSRTLTFLQIDGDRFAVRSIAPLVPDSGDGLQRIAQEATRTLLHFNRQNQFTNPEQIVLAAEDVWESSRVSALGAAAKLPVACVDANGSVAVPSGEKPAEAMSWARLSGAASVAFGRHGPTASLIPKAIQERQRRRQKTPWFVAAAVLVAVAPLAPIFILLREATVDRRDYAKKEKSLAPLAALSKRMEAHQEEMTKLRRDAETLEELARHRVAWSEFLADLQSRFATVEDVWLERMQTIPPEGDAPMKLVIGGYILARSEKPVAARAKALVRELRTLPLVASVEEERFDASRPYLLRFQLVLVFGTEHTL